MPVVLPFRAVRPAGAAASSLADRLAPPYDVIAPAERARLAQAPFNPVHLILPQDDPAAGEGSRYAAAARTLAAWRAGGALARDAAPAFYAYEQEFEHRGARRVRHGFFGLIELAPFGEGGVYAHEHTLTAPKEDRFRLLEATETNFSPVFFLYEDPAGEARRALDAARAGAPLGRADTAEGREALWALADDAGIGAIVRTLGAQGVVVADGHHRYESALRHRDARRAAAAAAGGPPPPRACDFMLACFVDVTDPGVLVLPTHRVLRGLPAVTASRLAERLAGTLVVTPLGAVAGAAEGVARAEAFLAAHPAGAFVFAPAGERALWGLEIPAALRDAAFGDAPTGPVSRGLDVVQLHELVLGRGLGITAEALAAQSHVEYVKAAADALAITWGEGATSGAVAGAAAAQPPTAAFLLNGTPVGQVLAAGRAGERMPQKATYFLPKITTGWTYHVHEAADAVWGPAGPGAPAWRPTGG